jgi:hypothetical protein
MQAKKLSSVRKEESASLLHNVQYSKLLFRCFPQNAYLFTYLFVHLFTCSLHAQIGIGSADNPLTGTILDLSCGAVGGLMLSNVSIEHPAEIPDDFPGVSGADETVVKADLTGSIVYNTNENTCVGVHVWDGNRWVQLASNISRKSSGEPLSIISDVTNLLENDTVKFAVATTAKICTWYVNSDNAGYKYLATTTMPSFSGVFPDGSHKVKVILNNCHFLEESNEVSFAPGRISPHFGSTAGGNYIYVYGDFPYVAIDDYTQSGLVAHYDGINNTGQGDKYHSNNNGTGWTNLATKQTINRNNFTPNADGGWKTNGWKVTNNAGFWSETIPSGIPTGAASNTIEIIYTTPDNGISVNSNARKGLFGYGNLMVEADRTRRAFQYDRNSLYAPDNWSCNVEYTQKDYPDLFAGNKLISLAVSYKGGVALSSSNASIAYFSGVKATPSNVNNCIPDIASAGQFYLG